MVEVYFDCARVELFLNGKSLGKKRPKECRCMFKTRYVPGELEAVAYDASGKELGRSVLESAQAASIHIQPEQPAARPGQIQYIPITIGDGVNVESNADKKLKVTVENGELLAFGSANPRTEEQYHTGIYTTYYGRALAIVKAKESGSLKISVAVEE